MIHKTLDHHSQDLRVNVSVGLGRQFNGEEKVMGGTMEAHTHTSIPELSEQPF